MLVCRGGEQKIHDNKKDKQTQNGLRQAMVRGETDTDGGAKRVTRGRESEEGR